MESLRFVTDFSARRRAKRSLVFTPASPLPLSAAAPPAGVRGHGEHELLRRAAARTARGTATADLVDRQRREHHFAARAAATVVDHQQRRRSRAHVTRRGGQWRLSRPRHLIRLASFRGGRRRPPPHMVVRWARVARQSGRGRGFDADRAAGHAHRARGLSARPRAAHHGQPLGRLLRPVVQHPSDRIVRERPPRRRRRRRARRRCLLLAACALGDDGRAAAHRGRGGGAARRVPRAAAGLGLGHRLQHVLGHARRGRARAAIRHPAHRRRAGVRVRVRVRVRARVRVRVRVRATEA